MVNHTRNQNTKWQSAKVLHFSGTIEEVSQQVPLFERRGFGMELEPIDRDKGAFFLEEYATPPCQTPPCQTPPNLNRYYDAIVRMPMASENCAPMPVGIVSRQYSLLQHKHLINEIVRAIDNVGIAPSKMQAHLDLTEYGERMRLGLLFPKEYNLDVGEGDQMALRLECFNSVDGSTKFMAVLGWLRFVCLNGMVLGVADTDVRRRHNKSFSLQDIVPLLRDGIASTTGEGAVYQAWRKRKVHATALAKWTDTILAKRWGVKAATRTWHIIHTGNDVAMADLFEKAPPTAKAVNQGDPVPGAVIPGDNLFAVSQALSWLAKERRDVQEQAQWQQEIPELIQELMIFNSN